MTVALRLIWLATLAAVIIGSVLSAQSAAIRLIDRAGINDKAEHFTAYALLAALPSLERFRCRRHGAIVAFLLVLGALLEFAQLVSPGRTCDWHDLLANASGIFAGVALIRITRFLLHCTAPLPDTPFPPSHRSSEHPRTDCS